ncbi:MAG: PhzF family phenazine biosynthesis protein [Pseudomonadota bacterium]
MKLTIVDVFAERQFEGNQLAVIEDAAALSTATMQTIARETNFSETTFVIERTGDEARVRIFTPEDELPFAGHPTLGTAWVLTGGQGAITLRLDAGPVTVSFAADGVGSFEPPPVTLNGAYPRALAAALVNLTVDDLHATADPELTVVGPEFLLIPVASLDALRAARVDEHAYRAQLAETPGIRSLFLFSEPGYTGKGGSPTGGDIAARMFFDTHGFREDPATGSANSALAAYLSQRHGRTGRIVVDQGVEILRPSRLYLELGERLRVGGRVFESVRGELLVGDSTSMSSRT